MTSGHRRRLRSQLLNRDGRAVILHGTRYLYCRCMWCEVEFAALSLTIEHIVPKYEGGTDEMTNLGVACYRCNNGRNPHFERNGVRPPVGEDKTTQTYPAP